MEGVSPAPHCLSAPPPPTEPGWELGSSPDAGGGAGSPKEPLVGLHGPDSLGPGRDGLPARMLGRTHSRGPLTQPEGEGRSQ